MSDSSSRPTDPRVLESFDPPIRRARVEELTIYEVDEAELRTLEHGPPEAMFLNVAIAAISIAISLAVALATMSTESQLIQTFFVVGIIVGFSGGGVLLLVWRRGRNSTRDCVELIRSRLPPPWSEVEVRDDPSRGSA